MAAPEDRSWFRERLKFHLDPYLALTPEQIDELFNHFELLRRWNARINLTSIRSAEEIVLRHYCESLFVASVLPEMKSCADVGSGAGFPGVPLAIFRPECPVALIESHQRKAVFLRESTRELKNVRILCERAEDVGEQFDWIVSRAVAPESVLRLVPTFAEHVALLIGVVDFETMKKDSKIDWYDPVQIPWGAQLLVVTGVPRGTSNVER